MLKIAKKLFWKTWRVFPVNREVHFYCPYSVTFIVSIPRLINESISIQNSVSHTRFMNFPPPSSSSSYAALNNKKKNFFFFFILLFPIFLLYPVYVYQYLSNKFVESGLCKWSRNNFYFSLNLFKDSGLWEFSSVC